MRAPPCAQVSGLRSLLRKTIPTTLPVPAYLQTLIGLFNAAHLVSTLSGNEAYMESVGSFPLVDPVQLQRNTPLPYRFALDGYEF